MRYRILGPLGVQPAVDHPALRRRKPRIVLAMLLLHANEVVSTDALIDAVWENRAPERAKGSLQNSISHLRKALGEERLLSAQGGYVLQVDPGELDAEVFERLVQEADGEPPARRAERIGAALALWRGAALADFAFAEFAQPAIRRLEDEHGAAWELLFEAELELGHHTEITAELEGLVTEHPRREHLRWQLMLALYRSRRQTDALQVYKDYAEMLLDEGLEPGKELRQLQRAILNHDESLGAPSPAAATVEPAPTVRKVVSVLFADVEGSTRLASTVDAETLRAVMGRFFAAMRAVAERHGGTLEKFSGDDVMVVFGVPTVREEDPLRAVRAASEMRDALVELNHDLERNHGVRLGVRVGVNTGEVVAGDPRESPFVTGEAVNVGKRLQEAAAPGDVLLGPLTVSLTRGSVDAEPHGTLEVRGRPEPVATYRLVALVDDSSLGQGELGRLVGRGRELRRLREGYKQARDKRRTTLLLVLGEPGIGKTRLARELVNRLDDARILVGRCASYGEDATYLPLVEVVRQVTRESPLEDVLRGVDDADRVAFVLRALTGELDEPFSVADASWAAQRFFAALAREAPVLVVLDDLHWAAPVFLDLLEQLVSRTRGIPLVLLGLARPELTERRPQWAENAEARVEVRLERLSDEETVALVAGRGGKNLERRVLDRLVATAEGNPLFAEQLFEVVHERGPDALTSVPPTVDALIAGRLDGLERQERAALERAAVIGRDFRASELVALSPPEEAAIAAQTLASLARGRFVRRRRVAAVADTFAFQHVLIRDAAYNATPKERRAELHERFGDWLVERGDAPDEIVGFHLESAYRNLLELGPVGRHGLQLAREASECLGRAGMRAFKRNDLPATCGLLERAVALLPEHERTRELLVELGVARLLAGNPDDAEAAVRGALQLARAAEDRRIERRAELELEALEIHRHGSPERLLEVATAAVPYFENVGDHRSLGRAWIHVGWVQGAYFCRNSQWEQASEHALDEYRASGWPTTRCVSEFSDALLFGPRHVDDAIARATATLDDSAGRAGEATVLSVLALLEAMRANVDRGRELIVRAVAVHDELGSTLASLMCSTRAATIELYAGALEAALELYEGACTELDQRGFHAHLSTCGAEFADALYEAGRYDDAERWAEKARSYAGEGDVSAAFSWRAALAKVRARRGSFEEAESLAREAIDLVETTDALNQQGNVYLALAEVRRLAARNDEASAAVAAAVVAFERKGNVVSARRAR
jgi:class 3 adenylate cyclase/tetratricopeptide (TPR) repeat protein